MPTPNETTIASSHSRALVSPKPVKKLPGALVSPDHGIISSVAGAFYGAIGEGVCRGVALVKEVVDRKRSSSSSINGTDEPHSPFN